MTYEFFIWFLVGFIPTSMIGLIVMAALKRYSK